MKVILQENVENVGYVGDVLDVADGYARNFLLPRKKAIEANLRNVKALEHAKRVTAHTAKKIEHDLRKWADQLSAVSLTFPVQTGKDDKLFGSITAKDLEAGLLTEGFEVDRRNIQLAHPLKELGTFPVGVKVHRDVHATISVSLVKAGEQAQAQEAADGAEETEAAPKAVNATVETGETPVEVERPQE